MYSQNEELVENLSNLLYHIILLDGKESFNQLSSCAGYSVLCTILNQYYVSMDIAIPLLKSFVENCKYSDLLLPLKQEHISAPLFSLIKEKSDLPEVAILSMIVMRNIVDNEDQMNFLKEIDGIQELIDMIPQYSANESTKLPYLHLIIQIYNILSANEIYVFHNEYLFTSLLSVASEYDLQYDTLRFINKVFQSEKRNTFIDQGATKVVVETLKVHYENEVFCKLALESLLIVSENIVISSILAIVFLICARSLPNTPRMPSF